MINKMKNLKLVLLGLLVILASCNTKSANKEESSNNKKVNKMGTIKITKAEFISKVANFEASPDEWKYLGDKPCIVDFYATWCGPCKTIAPILEELAEEYKDKIYIYEVDTDQEQELAGAFGIRSIPSLLFCPMNGAPQMAQGAMPKAEFKRAIESILLNTK